METTTRAVSPDNQAMLRRATAFYRAGRFAECAALFEELAAGADPVEGHHGLGVLALGRNDRHTALRHFQAALTHAPGHANSLYWLDYLAEARDAVFEALLLYQTALAHEPRHHHAAEGVKRLAAAGRIGSPSEDPAAVHASATRQLAASFNRPATPAPADVAPADRFPEPSEASLSIGRGVRGRVTELMQFQQQAWNTGRFKQGYNFRLRTPDEALVEVEIRGQKIYGRLRNGDDVEVVRGFRRRGLVMATRLYNHSSRSEIARRII